MSRRISQPSMMSDMRPSAAPSQTSTERGEAEHDDDADHHANVEQVADDQIDDSRPGAPAKPDQSPMLVVPEGLVDSMAGKGYIPSTRLFSTYQQTPSDGRPARIR